MRKRKKIIRDPSPYDYVIMFKIVIVHRYYNLCDDSTEDAILDRLSFMRFLLTIFHTAPDSNTNWNFKNELSKGDMVNKLFKKLEQ